MDRDLSLTLLKVCFGCAKEPSHFELGSWNELGATSAK